MQNLPQKVYRSESRADRHQRLTFGDDGGNSVGGALRGIGRVVRNIGDNLADIPIREIPWFSLSWLGRGVARLFFSSGRDMSDAAAGGLGLAVLVLLGIIAVGLFNWLRESPGSVAPAPGPDRGQSPPNAEKPWWE